MCNALGACRSPQVSLVWGVFWNLTSHRLFVNRQLYEVQTTSVVYASDARLGPSQAPGKLRECKTMVDSDESRSNLPGAHPRRKTLGSLEQAYFVGGGHELQDALAESAPEPRQLGDYIVNRSSDANPELRTDVLESDKLSYLSYGPPNVWQTPYEIHRVLLDPLAKQLDFIYHPGEELLTPILGPVQYHFFWTPGGKRPSHDKVKLLEPGDIARINPSLPHHGWLPEHHETQGQAWMIFSNDIPTAISLDRRFQRSGSKHRPRRVSSSQLSTEGRYALIAWGLADAIRLRRHAADLPLSELADAAEIDRSYLLRIERGDANPSVSTLMKLADALHIDVQQHLQQSAWHFHDATLWPKSRPAEQVGVICTDPTFAYPHVLHTSSIELGVKALCSPKTTAEFASWIILDGNVDASISPRSRKSSGQNSVERLGVHSVLHVRDFADLQFEGVTKARILGIQYARECPFNQGMKGS